MKSSLYDENKHQSSSSSYSDYSEESDNPFILFFNKKKEEAI